MVVMFTLMTMKTGCSEQFPWKKSAAHELGHSLGLAHSKVRQSLMSPFYSGYKTDLALNSEAIDGIQALYGKENTIENRNFDEYINTRSIFISLTSLPPPIPDNIICKVNIDTIQGLPPVRDQFTLSLVVNIG
jgi:hypothetical protein